MNIEDLTLGQIRELQAITIGASAQHPSKYPVGKNVIVRTVTMIYTGKLQEVTATDLVLVDCSWIPETERFMQFVANGSVKECEPYPDGLPVFINRGALLDMCAVLLNLCQGLKNECRNVARKLVGVAVVVGVAVAVVVVVGVAVVVGVVVVVVVGVAVVVVVGVAVAVGVGVVVGVAVAVGVGVVVIMKSELEFVGASYSKLWDVPLESPLGKMLCRKQVNEAAHSLTHDALFKNDLPLLSEKLASMMVVTARILVGMQMEPDLENFVYACAELIGFVRKGLDDALRFDNKDDVKLWSVAAEIVLKGCAATLALPLDKLMEEVLASEVDGRAPDIQSILTKFKEGK